MQPIGLTAAQRNRYHAHLFASHDFDIGVEVLRIDGRVIASIEPTLLDGQVNVSTTEVVGRTATCTLYDPDRTLHMDAFSPWEGALYADRMIRIRHTVTVPGLGTVDATPFVGPVVKLSRDGDTVAVEAQDKTSLAITGARPYKVKKGRNAVAAIRAILRDCTGENNFRFPAGVKRTLTKTYNVGWAEESSPWLVCKRIARTLSMDLFYSCDGYATLRKRSKSTVITVRGEAITEAIKADFDVTTAANRVMVSGSAPIAKSGVWGQKTVTTITTPVSAAAQVAKSHPLHPNKLGRNGVPRFLPIVEAKQKFKKTTDAATRARAVLADKSRMGAEASFSMVPLFSLDPYDRLKVETERGFVVVQFVTASIPLGVNGEMSVGQTRRVARGRRA